MRVLLALACTLTGCSFGMKRVPSGWDGTSEPDCNDSPVPMIGDAIVAGLSLALAAGAADASIQAQDQGEANTGADALAIGGFAVAFGFTISAIVGEVSYKRCENAKAEWRLGGAIGAGVDARNAAAAERFEREHRDELAPEPAKAQQPAAPIEPPQPRGYFCSESPSNDTVGFCVREKPECERTRDLSINALPDLTMCTLVESAWCLGDLCFPTEGACAARRDRTGSGVCAETK